MGFFQKYKKFIFLIIFLAVVFLIGFFIYNTFFRPAPIVPSPEPGEEPKATTTQPGFLPGADVGEGVIIDEDDKDRDTLSFIPGAGRDQTIEVDDRAMGGVTKTTDLNDSPSLNPTLSTDGRSVQYYDKNNGKFYKVDPDGKLTLLSDKEFYDVESVSWSPTENKAVIEYPDGSNIVYDFDKEKQITLPKHWESFQFSTEGDNLVMKSIGLDPDNRWLAISNSDGSRARAVERIGENADNVYPSWSPNNQSVAMYTQSLDFDRQEVFFVGQNDENFKSTIIEGRGFQPKWSEEGDKLLYSVYSTSNDLKPKLWVVNAQGDSIGTQRKSLGLETWAEKCAFGDNDQVYCAIPDEMPEGAGLFPEMAQNTKDRLYKIDLKTGLKKIIAVPDKAYNMSDLMVSEDGQNLYFTDFSTERLHKIRLQ